MGELDIIREIAKGVLLLPIEGGVVDSWFWDNANRLARTVDFVRGLPELSDSGYQIDRFCLLSAAYFCDAGVVSHLKNTKRRVGGTVSYAERVGLLNESANIASEKLTGLTSRDKIGRITRIILESGVNFTKVTEAMILSDARNLEEMGSVGVFNELRRLTSEGRGISSAVLSWERKIDYRYWDVRLRESFRFESVRRIAKQRLNSADYFMKQLKSEIEGLDIEDMAASASLV